MKRVRSPNGAHPRGAGIYSQVTPMTKLEQLKRRLAADEGQALVEYALILGLIAIAAVAILSALGTDINGMLSRVDVALRSAV